MNKYTQAISDDLGLLAEDARSLMEATADVAGDKVVSARKRLEAALERSKKIAGGVRDRAVQGAKMADEAVRENPYKAMVVGLGIGVVTGFLIARLYYCDRD